MTYWACAVERARVDQAMVRSDCGVMCMLEGRNAVLGLTMRLDSGCNWLLDYIRRSLSIWSLVRGLSNGS